MQTRHSVRSGNLSTFWASKPVTMKSGDTWKGHLHDTVQPQNDWQSKRSGVKSNLNWRRHQTGCWAHKWLTEQQKRGGTKPELEEIYRKCMLNPNWLTESNRQGVESKFNWRRRPADQMTHRMTTRGLSQTEWTELQRCRKQKPKHQERQKMTRFGSDTMHRLSALLVMNYRISAFYWKHKTWCKPLAY